VVHARVDERLLDPVAIDGDGRLIGVLLDDREQIAEQAPLGRGQLDTLDRRVGIGARELVDRRTRRRDQRRRRAPPVIARLRPRRLTGRRDVLILTAGTAQALGRGFALVRYRCPSSYRCA
jgi:hypothetical protein